MANVVACYKWVLDEADLRINADLSVDLSRAKGKISDYDKNAIEAANRAAQILGGKAIGATFGSSGIKASFKDTLSRGLDEGMAVITSEFDGFDSTVTSRALAAAIAKDDDIAMVICGEGSSDNYARQIAPRIGALLDWPVITSVSKIEVAENRVIATRTMDDCMQTVTVELPVVLAVLPEINPAPIPGLKAVMEARKKPITELIAADLGVNLTPGVDAIEVKGYAADRKNNILPGDTNAEKVMNLLEALRKEGVL